MNGFIKRSCLWVLLWGTDFGWMNWFLSCCFFINKLNTLLRTKRSKSKGACIFNSIIYSLVPSHWKENAQQHMKRNNGTIEPDVKACVCMCVCVVMFMVRGGARNQKGRVGDVACVCLPQGFRSHSPHLTERSPSATDTPSIIQEVSMKNKWLLPAVRGVVCCSGSSESFSPLYVHTEARLCNWFLSAIDCGSLLLSRYWAKPQLLGSCFNLIVTKTLLLCLIEIPVQGKVQVR